MRPLTLSEAAGRLGLTTGRLRQLIGEGRLKAEKAGAVWLVREAELRRFGELDRRPGRPKA